MPILKGIWPKVSQGFREVIWQVLTTPKAFPPFYTFLCIFDDLRLSHLSINAQMDQIAYRVIYHFSGLLSLATLRS